jgi:hypothetical protein
MAAEIHVMGSGDERDDGTHHHLASARMCASQPAPSTLKKSSSTSSTSAAENAIKIDKDVFGGFTQPAQVQPTTVQRYLSSFLQFLIHNCKVSFLKLSNTFL